VSKGASQLCARHTPSNGCPTTAAYTAKTPAVARVSSISYPASRRSPESNGMAEAFVQTFKGDYLRVNYCRRRRRYCSGSLDDSKTTTKSTHSQGSGCARLAS
jgi:hypothetical protein